MCHVFISHAHGDKEFVQILVQLFQNTILLEDTDIRCTSLSGYKLDPGSNISADIKNDLQNADIVLGVITPNSLSSNYVLFELGAAWFQEKAIAILGPGAYLDDIPGPLQNKQALDMSNESDINELIVYVSRRTKRGQKSSRLYNEIQDFRNAFLKTKVIGICERMHPVPERTYKPEDFNKVWPQTMMIEDRFLAISLIHPELWQRDEAITGVYTLGGVKHVNKTAVIRRIFIIDSLNEILDLEAIIRLHLNMNIEIHYFTLEEYQLLCKNSNKIIGNHLGIRRYSVPVEGFTVSNLSYQSSFPKDVCVIHYNVSPNEREVIEFNTFKRNEDQKVKAYIKFFRKAWEESHAITDENLRNLLIRE